MGHTHIHTRVLFVYVSQYKDRVRLLKIHQNSHKHSYNCFVIKKLSIMT
jgi:hypothetical protein